MTGSRVAGSCGRIPVESSVCKLYPSLAPLGFATGSASLTSATFVDNIYAFSSNAADAVQQLVLIEEDLKSCWGLTIKQDSKEYMVCKGGVSSGLSAPWRPVENFICLGHIIAHDSCMWPCWRQTQRRVWASFFKDAGSNLASHLGMKQNLGLLRRSSQPVWEYRCVRWPPSRKALTEDKRLHRKLLGAMSRLRPDCEETPEQFILRRNRQVARLAQEMGSWSERHKKLCRNWYEHLLRDRNSRSFASILVKHRDAQFLDTIRAWRAGRHYQQRGTGTRSKPGWPKPRWEEQVLKT